MPRSAMATKPGRDRSVLACQPSLATCSPHHHRDVVASAALERVLHQGLAHLLGGGHRAEPVADPLVGDVAGKPVAAEQHDGVPGQLELGDRRGGLAPADGAGEGVLEARAAGVRPAS